ncbi:carbohydrate-binding domain-containing protein [bacterium]|nr:carbohydrate-binding domain-containing protein [bacterium]
MTGGTYNITASKKAIDANDSIRIMDGTFVLNAQTD